MSCLVKICLLLCMVSASQCTPTFGILSSIFGKHHHSVLHHHHTGVVVKGTLGILHKLIRSIGDVAKTARNIFHEILGISTCNGYGDIGNFIIRVGHAQGNLINQFLPEVGTFFSRLIEAATRIVVCVGLQPVRIIFSSPRPPICSSSYGTDFGCLPYKGKYDTCDSVLTGYNLDLHLWLKRLTSSKYYNLKDSVGIIVREIITIIKLTINFKTKIVRDDLLRLFSRVTTILAVLGESLEHNYGVQIIDKCFSIIYKVFGSDYSVCVSERNEAKEKLKGCKQTRFDGTLNKDDDDSDDDNSNDKENKKEESGNKKPGPKNDKKHDSKDKNKDESEGNKKHESERNDEHKSDDSNKPGPKKDKKHDSEDNNEGKSEGNKKHDSERNDEHKSDDSNKPGPKNDKKHDSEDNNKDKSEGNNKHESENKEHESEGESNESKNDKNDSKDNKNHEKDDSKNKNKKRVCHCE